MYFPTDLLADDKIWILTILKAFADDKFNVAKLLNSLFDRVNNIVGKGEYAGYQQTSCSQVSNATD